MGLINAFKGIDIFGATVGPQRTFNSLPGATLTFLLYLVMVLRFWQDARDTYSAANAVISSFDKHTIGGKNDLPMNWEAGKMYVAFGLFNTQTN